MSATFYERILTIGDWESDGGGVSPDVFAQMCACYESGQLTAAHIKEHFTAETTDETSNANQQADIQDILDTLPATVTVVTGVDFGIPPSVTTDSLPSPARARWAFRLWSILYLAVNGFDGFATENDMKSKLGVS